DLTVTGVQTCALPICGETGVIVKITDLVRDKVLTEVSDLADHSDRTGMRIQIELKRRRAAGRAEQALQAHTAPVDVRLQRRRARSEERRVGNEGWSRW